MTERPKAPEAPEPVERFVKQLNIAYKAVRLYPPSSAIPRENAAETVATLRTLLQRDPSVRLGVTRDSLVYGDAPVFAGQPAFEAFAREFYARHLAEVRFHAGVTEAEVLRFLSLLDVTPEDLAAAGGFEARLWDAQVDNITVKEVSQRVVDLEPQEAAEKFDLGEEWPPDNDRIGEILAGAVAGRPRDQRLLVRVLEQPSFVAAYLSRTVEGEGPSEAWITQRLSELASVVGHELPDEQEAGYRSLAEAVLELEPGLRAEVMRGRLLESARTDDGLASVLRSMGLREGFQAILGEDAKTTASTTGMTRAIRNLTTIKQVAREQVSETLAPVLAESGLDPATQTRMLEEVAPQKVRVPQRRAAEEPAAEAALRLLDLSPTDLEGVDEEDGIERLREEARRGVTDGDILDALVTIVAVDRRSEQFASVMSLLEDSLGLLIERQEFDVAVSAASALTGLLASGRLTDAEQQRVEGVLSSLASTSRMRILTTAMRVHPLGSAEHSDCKKLLSILTQYAISPLLEVLADEPDMAARKAIIELISGLSRDYVGALGSRVSDSRWYFVRNVVTILGATHDPEVLPYLERTLRHSDARVRRETIRALAGIHVPRALEMLAASLGDDEAQNVQLAARYLGTLKARAAVGELMKVAAGEGHGNRETGARVEAIEALGRMGATEAEELLTSISRQRVLLGGARVRELRAAAQGALGALKARGVTAREGSQDG